MFLQNYDLSTLIFYADFLASFVRPGMQSGRPGAMEQAVKIQRKVSTTRSNSFYKNVTFRDMWAVNF